MAKAGIIEHPKTGALARDLGIPVYAAVGILECLWQWTARYARRGDMGRWTDEDIATGIGWPVADTERLISALVAQRWLDRHQEHRLLVHGWPEHAQDSIHMALARAGETFADGTPPRTNRLSAAERRKTNNVRTEYAQEAPQPTGSNDVVRTKSAQPTGDSPSCAHVVRTVCAQDCTVCAQDCTPCALPLPLPLPFTPPTPPESGGDPPRDSKIEGERMKTKNGNGERRSAEEIATAGKDEARPGNDQAGADPPVMFFPAKGKIGPNWAMRQSELARRVELYPNLGVPQVLRGAIAHLEANPQKQPASKRGMRTFLTGWLNREVRMQRQDDQRRVVSSSSPDALSDKGRGRERAPAPNPPNATLATVWERAREKIREQALEEDWEAYLEPVELLGTSNGFVVLAVESVGRQDWLGRRYGGLLRECLGKDVEIRVMIPHQAGRDVPAGTPVPSLTKPADTSRPGNGGEGEKETREGDG